MTFRDLWAQLGQDEGVMQRYQHVLDAATSGNELGELLRRNADLIAKGGASTLVQLALSLPPSSSLHRDGAEVFAQGPKQAWIVPSWGAGLTEGHLFRTLLGHEGSILCVRSVGDGTRLLSGGADGMVRLWNHSGECIWQAQGHRGAVQSLAADYQSGRAVSAGADSLVKVWDIRSGQMVSELRAPYTHAILTVALQPDGLQAAFAGKDDRILVMDIASGKVSRQYEVEGQTSALLFHPDGRLLSASDDAVVRSWEGARKKPLTTFKGEFTGAQRLQLHPNGKHLIQGDARQLSVWSLESEKRLRVHECFVVVALAFDAVRDRILVGTRNGKVTALDFETLQPVWTMPSRADELTSLAVLDSPNLLAVSGANGRIQLWSMNSVVRPSDSERAITAVAVDPSGKAAICTDGGAVSCRALSDGAVLWERPAKQGTAVLSLLIPPSESSQFVVRSESELRWCRMDSEVEEPIALPTPARTPMQMGTAEKPRPIVGVKGGDVLVGAGDGCLHLFAGGSHQRITSFQGHSAFGEGVPVTALAFTQEGDCTVSGGEDQRVIAWTTSSGQKQFTLEQANPVAALAFANAGTQLLVGLKSGEVALWDLATRKKLVARTLHPKRVVGLGFLPQHGLGVSCGEDGTLKLWELKGLDVLSHWSVGKRVRSFALGGGGEALIGTEDGATCFIIRQSS
jgi:WD40 repeat protein